MPRSTILVSLALLGGFLHPAAAPAPGQDRQTRRAEERSLVLEGFVLASDGSPAEGARVTSSAGGSAVTDRSGCYRLECQVPLASLDLELTVRAADDASHASTLVDVGPGGARRVDPLQLAAGSSCEPGWQPTFGGIPGTNGDVHALVVHDDGSGPALYAGGSFTIAGGVPANRIARWDGSSWSPLAGGVGVSQWDEVLALSVYDDGSGPALYAGGQFTSADGHGAHSIARWDGSSWSALGDGLRNAPRLSIAHVSALTVFDDGSGPALYAGGTFTLAGGAPARNVARWDGATWTALGSGTSDEVSALTVHDDGGGAALYAGGNFTSAGGTAALFIARWDGSSWSAVGGGMNAGVGALVVHDEGGGPVLFAAGGFSSAGGAPAFDIARWDGSSWTDVGGGLGAGLVKALAVYDDGSGPKLYAGGPFTHAGGAPSQGFARWDGASWSALPYAQETINALTVVDDGRGPALLAGLDVHDTLAPGGIAKWDGLSWSTLEQGLDGDVYALIASEDGQQLYAGGLFRNAGGMAVNRVARWDGASWSPLGSGVGNPMNLNDVVRALELFDEGAGPVLYAGGFFAGCIERWDGASWSLVGGGVSSTVRALKVFDDGAGPALYVAGQFTSAGGIAMSMIARWNGSSWSPLGSGISGTVTSLAVFDDGSGPALYVGGIFAQAGGSPANRIARWDGASWSTLGNGLDGGVDALAVHDDGSGPALYAGGSFTSASGVAANRIARWDGSSWSALGTGTGGQVLALTSEGSGEGAALIAGGSFTSAGGVAAQEISRWNGTSWAPLGSGLSSSVRALVVLDGRGASRPSLVAGGSFRTAFDSHDGYLARWACPPPVTIHDKIRPR